MGVFFSKRVGKLGTRLVQKRCKFVEADPHPTISSNSLTKHVARRVRNVMEPLQTQKKLKDSKSRLQAPGGPRGPSWALTPIQLCWGYDVKNQLKNVGGWGG